MKMKNILFLLIVLIFVACNSSQNKMVKKGRKQNNTVKAPAWFKNPPTGKSNLFAVATARSTHADYAINKGLQNAYAEMSRIVQSHLNGMVLNLVEEYGNKYYNEIRSISQLISKNSIAGIRIVKQDIYQEGPYFYSFFLAALPVSGINNNMKNRLNELKELKGKINFSESLKNENDGKDDLLKLVNLHKVSGKYAYPKWFLNGTETDGTSVIGYAPKAYYKDNAATEAIENGIWNFLLFNENRIYGSISNVLAAEQDFLARDNLHEIIDSSRFEAVLNNLNVLDTTFVNDICLVILGKNKEVKEKETKRITQIPEWVINVPEEKSFAYAVGVAPVYHHEKSSWLEAEADSRKKLALRQKLQVESIMTKEGRKFEEVNKLNLDARINKAKIVGRFRNKYMVFVLIKMPLN